MGLLMENYGMSSVVATSRLRRLLWKIVQSPYPEAEAQPRPNGHSDCI